MNNETNKRIPELRFPEFVNNGEWVKDFLGKISSNISTGKLDANAMVENGTYRFYTCAKNYYRIDKYAYDTEAILIAGNGAYLGYIHHYNGKFNAYQRTYVLSDFSENILYLKYFLERYLPSRISEEKKDGNTPYIVLSTITDMEVYLPKEPTEQQKIASCLSSLDEVITAQTNKLETLKTYKKGLMQNLFPQEGEKVPKLRFKEFEKDKQWEEKSIQTLIDEQIIISHLDGNHGALYPQADEFSNEGVPYITANDFVNGVVEFEKCKFLPNQRALQFKKGVAKDGDILFAHNATVGPVAKLNTKLPFVILSTTATYFRCNNKLLLNDFLKYALSSPRFVKQYTRVMSQSTRNQVPITTQRKFDLQLPPIKEQQKIADILSSLDELINEQVGKIEQLQLHKKGLMQGLFPKVKN